MDEIWRYGLPLLAVVLLIRGIRNMKKPSIESAMNLMAKKRYQDAEHMLLPFAEKGDLKAMALLGSTYFFNGKSDEAVKILEKAADRGFLEANSTLAGVFYDGQFVPKDITRARHYLKPVAESGNVRMQRQYGLWSVTDKDFEEGDKWLAMAARYGDKEAQADRDHLKDVRAGKVRYVESPTQLWDDEMRPLVSGGDSPALNKTDAQSRAYDALVEDVAKEVVDAVGGGKRPHYPTVLSTLGALAGFGSQMAIREGLIKAGKITERQAFVIVDCADGRKFYFGDLVNRPLIEYPISVFSLVKGGVHKAGSEKYPNITEIARRVAHSIGGKEYGSLFQPKKYQPSPKPVDSLKQLWPKMHAKVTEAAAATPAALDIKEMGWVFAAAAQRQIVKAVEAGMPAEVAGEIVMEAAMSMSKIEPKVIEPK